ncbi:hypothetical protein V8E36_002101 [Tilletia maclaganii]
MHVRALLPIVVVFLTWMSTTDAKDVDMDHSCSLDAHNACPGPDQAPARKQFYQHCMQVHWGLLVKNATCPHREDDCRCYNGCVLDRHRDVKDVGAWCRAQSLQFPPM